jgi:hypothetical protein
MIKNSVTVVGRVGNAFLPTKSLKQKPPNQKPTIFGFIDVVFFSITAPRGQKNAAHPTF